VDDAAKSVQAKPASPHRGTEHLIEVVLEVHVKKLLDDSRGGRNKAAINPLKSQQPHRKQGKRADEPC